MPAQAPAIAPFYKCLHRFLAFPLQFEPLLYLALAALVTYPLQYLVFLFRHPFVYMPFIALALLCIGMAAARYGFKIMILGSQGVWHSGAFPRDELLENMEWTHLPWKLLAVLVVACAAAWGLGQLVSFGFVLMLLQCLLPASLVVLASDASLRGALDPWRLLEVIRLIGPGYMLLCIICMLLPHAVLAVNAAASRLLHGLLWGMFSHLAWPIAMFVALYALWAFCSMLGHAMYQHHAALGIEPLPDTAPADAPAGRLPLTPEQKAQHKVDAHIRWLLKQGDFPAALEAARQDQFKHPQNLAAQQRYLALLLLDPGKAQALCMQGRYVIDLHLHQHNANAALKVYKACKRKVDDFAVQDAAQCLELARAAWQGSRDARLVLAVLKGFDLRFAGHESIPEAWALGVRAYAQGLQDLPAAQRIFTALQQRYPDSAWTEEIQRLLGPLVMRGKLSTQ